MRPILVRPKSKGRVTLRTSNPRDDPYVDFNYLAHPEDLATYVEGIKLCIALGNAPAIKEELNAKFYDRPLAECAGERPGSDRYWACFVQHMATSFVHYVGTCKMAPSSDPYGVVDQRLRVRGVGGLRVVDASVMPTVPTGNPNAAAIIVAEKAADLIKEDWGS
ncbi:hypothetical protein Pcinc_033141 [Petrolisthes cinctipes]|uniref:Glucose-methanol-choline oxidoreductase C-terminal domain-containing protein n=1 Tax=Petrolisthes cinctipes TaxID=88211 RepID=A0AAE1ESR0_PETCI|nr:hypothetical protein Pcinc_033141 [Petrolisthes cinctipes]